MLSLSLSKICCKLNIYSKHHHPFSVNDFKKGYLSYNAFFTINHFYRAHCNLCRITSNVSTFFSSESSCQSWMKPLNLIACRANDRASREEQIAAQLQTATIISFTYLVRETVGQISLPMINWWAFCQVVYPTSKT